MTNPTTIKEVLATTVNNLFKVKSIVTIILTIVFAVLALKRVITGEQFMMIFTVVVGFYFGTQAQKIADGKEEATNKEEIQD